MYLSTPTRSSSQSQAPGIISYPTRRQQEPLPIANPDIYLPEKHLDIASGKDRLKTTSIKKENKGYKNSETHYPLAIVHNQHDHDPFRGNGPKQVRKH